MSCTVVWLMLMLGDTMNASLLAVLTTVIVATVICRGENLGEDTNGPWITETHTNLTILRGTNSEVVENVVTNRITEAEYPWRKKIASLSDLITRDQVITRDEVEKIIPPYTKPHVEDQKSFYTVMYWVDEHWKVVIMYAYPEKIYDEGAGNSRGNSALWKPPVLFRSDRQTSGKGSSLSLSVAPVNEALPGR